MVVVLWDRTIKRLIRIAVLPSWSYYYRFCVGLLFSFLRVMWFRGCCLCCGAMVTMAAGWQQHHLNPFLGWGWTHKICKEGGLGQSGVPGIFKWWWQCAICTTCYACGIRGCTRVPWQCSTEWGWKDKTTTRTVRNWKRGTECRSFLVCGGLNVVVGGQTENKQKGQNTTTPGCSSQGRPTRLAKQGGREGVKDQERRVGDL